MAMTVKVAAAQMAPVFLDREATVEKACALIREAGAKGADIIGFPEGFIPAHPSWYGHLPATGARSMELARALFRNAVEIPGPATEALSAACREVVARQEIENGYVRPVAWRGSEMMAVSAQNSTIHTAIAAWTWPTYFGGDAQLRGIRLTISDWRRPAPNTAPTQSKAAGLYMICTLAKHKAEAAGYDDALMLDYRGLVAEATGANFFMVQDGALHTPVPDCFLDGITRRTVISLAREAGIEVVERQIRPEDLAKAQEAFLTGTAVELTPICEIDAHHFEVGPVTHRLVEGFERLVHAVGDSAASAA